jgi:Glycosyltransferase family 87
VPGAAHLIDRRVRPWLWLGLAVAASVVSWCYMHRVLIPWETHASIAEGRLKQHMGDLYPPWLGTRELLVDGRDPYSAVVSHEIQTTYYGHPIEQTYDKPPSEMINEQRFAYPIYVVFLLAPTAKMEFSEVQNWAPSILAVLVAITVWIWTQVVRWRPPLLTILSVMLFVIATPQLAQGLRMRQLGLLVAFLLAAASWCVTLEKYGIAGILLAFSTIKPQIVLLLVAWFVLWSLSDIRKRWPLLASFGISLGILVGIGAVLLPSWPIDFLRGLDAYRHYVPMLSPLSLLLGDWIGGGLSILIVVALFAHAWGRRYAAPDSSEFVETLALFFLVTILVLPLMTPNNQVQMLLPTILVLRDWKRLPRAAWIAFTAVVAWPWLISLLLLVRPPAIESMSRLPLLPSWPVLLVPFLLTGLFYMRPRELNSSLS